MPANASNPYGIAPGPVGIGGGKNSSPYGYGGYSGYGGGKNGMPGMYSGMPMFPQQNPYGTPGSVTPYQPQQQPAQTSGLANRINPGLTGTPGVFQGHNGLMGGPWNPNNGGLRGAGLSSIATLRGGPPTQPGGHVGPTGPSGPTQR